MTKKILFLDRDGTLIFEPDDGIIDSIDKLKLEPDVIPALEVLRDAGFTFVMVTNQRGVGSDNFPEENFWGPHNKMLEMFAEHNIKFEDTRMCPHLAEDNCECRKPKTKLVEDYIADPDWDRAQSFMIGDRQTDIEFAKGVGIKGLIYSPEEGWNTLAERITSATVS